MNKISDKLKIRKVRTQIVRLKENLQKPKVKTVLTVILLGGELFLLLPVSSAKALEEATKAVGSTTDGPTSDRA